MACTQPPPTPLPSSTQPPTDTLLSSSTAEPMPSSTSTATIPPSPTAEPTPSSTLAAAALVNGEPITLQAYERRVYQFQLALASEGIDPESQEGQEELKRMRPQILDGMIKELLVIQAAQKEGITISEEEVEKEVQKNIALGSQEDFESWLAATGFTSEEFRQQVRFELLSRATFEKVTASVPKNAEQVHARQILLKTEGEAREVLRQLEGGADFAALARLHSQDESTKEEGGDLGFFPRGLLAPEVEEAAFSLAPGQTSDVIRSTFGYHIIQVLEKDPDRPLSEERWHGLRMMAYEKWLQERWEEATLQCFVEEEVCTK